MSSAVEEREAEAKKVDATAAPPSLVAKVVKAIAAAGEVVKDKTNTQQNYKFASVESMLKAIRGPLFAEGVLLQVQPKSFTDEETTSSSNTKGLRVVVEVDFTFTDGVESFTISDWRGEGIDYADKAYGKAYTNAIKTFIRAQWLLPADDELDGDRESPERGTTRAALPGWASPLDQERARELFNQLEVLVGADAAKSLMAQTKERADGIPALFLPLVKAVVETYLDTPVDELEARREHARAVAAGDAEPVAEPADAAPDAEPADADLAPDMEGLPAAGPLDGDPDPLFDGAGE